MPKQHTLEATSGSPSNERGATAVEYSIITALIAATVLLVVTFLGLDTLELFERVSF